MSRKLFTGRAAAVAKVVNLTVGGTLAGETFTVSVGGVIIASHTDTTTVISDTVAALVSQWNSSAHPYATDITANDSSPDMVLTSEKNGMDFEVTINTPGGSATFGQATAVANAGPNDWTTGDNWFDLDSETYGATPTNGDDVIIDANRGVNLCWGLDQSSVTLDSLKIMYGSGRVGLNSKALATTADGNTTNALVPEYRNCYLRIKVDQAQGDVIIGEIASQDAATVSGLSRVLLDLLDTQANVEIVRTAPTSADLGRPAVRLLCDHASTKIHVRTGCLGGVGVAIDQPGELATLGDLINSGKAYTGAGTTLATWTQRDSASEGVLMAAATVTTIDAEDGALTTEGPFAVTTLNVEAGTVTANNNPAAGDFVATANIFGGTLDVTKNNQARSMGTVTAHRGSTFQRNTNTSVTTLVTKEPVIGPG